MNIKITNHAIDRAWERLGIREGPLTKKAQKAFDSGIRHGDVNGSLRRYIDGEYLKYKNANNIRIHNQYVYYFKNNLLLTITEIPNKYKRYINKLKNKSCNN